MANKQIANKPELTIFMSKNKNITKLLNFRISGQKINKVNQTKYLGIYLYENLTWKFYSIKLNVN